MTEQGNVWTIVFDGGSLGNPGKGYGSYRLTGPGGFEERTRQDYPELGNRATNNQAEYQTLIRALERLRTQLGGDVSTAEVRIEGDSQLVLYQVSGKWKVRNEGLRPFHAEATRLLQGFRKRSIAWHPRKRSVDILGH